jgi:hypothetical protein
MLSRLLLNLGLLALVAVLGLLAFLEPGVAPPSPGLRIAELQAAEVEHIRIERSDAPAVRLERDGQGWRLREPVEVAANPFRIEAMLRVLTETSELRLDARELNLAEFGLEAPRVRLYLNELELAFGATAPLDGRRYLRIGDTVLLIADRHYPLLRGGVAELASPRLLPPQVRIRAIETADWRLARSGEARWALDPPRPELSADALPSLLQAWAHSEAVWLQDYTPAAEGLQDTVTVHIDGTDAALDFVLVAREPELILARPELGLQYHLADDTARRLLEPSAHAQESKLLPHGGHEEDEGEAQETDQAE